jgi:hypothetical protein
MIAICDLEAYLRKRTQAIHLLAYGVQGVHDVHDFPYLSKSECHVYLK